MPSGGFLLKKVKNNKKIFLQTVDNIDKLC